MKRIPKKITEILLIMNRQAAKPEADSFLSKPETDNFHCVFLPLLEML
jgi:hypothetical protein